GVTDVPATPIQVYVGMKPATLVSAGRGLCCDGFDPTHRVPPGIAAWDVIRFTIPDGVSGCFIPVAVQIGNIVSNISTISIAPNGGVCAPALSSVPELAQQLAGKTGVSLGGLNFGRSSGVDVNARGVVMNTDRDNGSAAFVRYPNAPASMFAP